MFFVAFRFVYFITLFFCLAHEFMVSAVSSDSLNEQVYTCGGEKEMKFWNFRTGKTIATLTLSSTVTSMLTYREKYAIVSLIDYFTFVIIADNPKFNSNFYLNLI